MQSSDPATISQMVTKFANIDYPLPSGFRYYAGAETAQGTSIRIVHDQNLQYITLSSVQLSEPTEVRDQTLLDKLLTPGRYDAGLGGKVVGVKDHGNVTIAGKSIGYGIVSVDKGGKQCEAFIAVLSNGQHSRITTIRGQQVQGPYDLAEMQSFLNAIKSM